VAIDTPNRAARRRKIRKPAQAVEPPPDCMALTVNEVAWELRCSPNTVWSLLAKGALDSFKVGRRRLIARSTLEHFGAWVRGFLLCHRHSRSENSEG
jgi:excisionase family DNA binding protein